MKEKQKVWITSRGLGCHCLEDQFGNKLGYGGIHFKDAMKRADALQEKIDKEWLENKKTLKSK